MNMSLRKLIKGNPGNIQEVIDLAKEKNIPVNVLFYAGWYPDQSGYSLTSGKAIYSIGNENEVLVHIDKDTLASFQ